MKQLTLVALLATSLACVDPEAQSPVRLLSVFPASGDSARCVISRDVAITFGSYDVATPSNYLLGIAMESSLTPPTYEVGDRELASPTYNDATIKGLIISYAFQPRSPSTNIPAQEELPVHFVIAAGSKRDGTDLLTPVLGPRVRAELSASIPQDAIATADDRFTLFVSIQAKGELGFGGDFLTNKITYPIILRNSGFDPAACANGLDRNGPCGLPGGQDGTVLRCAPPPT